MKTYSKIPIDGDFVIVRPGGTIELSKEHLFGLQQSDGSFLYGRLESNAGNPEDTIIAAYLPFIGFVDTKAWGGKALTLKQLRESYATKKETA